MKARFIQFLKENVEKELSVNSSIAYQALLDNLDDAYVDFEDTKIVVNVGNTIRNSKYNDLFVIVRKTGGNSVRYGSSEQYEHAIVIDTDKELPTQTSIDEFILSDEKIASKVKEFIKQYEFHDMKEPDEKYDNEKVNELEEDGKFDEVYNDVVTKAKSLIKQYENAVQELEKMTPSANIAKKHSAKLATDKLKTEILGKDENEFVNKIIKDDERFKHLDKVKVNKMTERLKRFFELKIKKGA